MLAFGVDLFLPFRLAPALKSALLAALLGGVLLLRERKTLLLFACIVPSALFWSSLTAYPLTPRYLYIASVFCSVLLGRLLCQACAYVGAALTGGEAWSRTSARLLAGAMALLIGVNAWALRNDLVLFEYLSLLGQRLAKVQAEVHRNGKRARVFTRPSSHLGKRDLAFFHREIDFVSSSSGATHVVDTDVDRFARTLGPGVEEVYWYFPGSKAHSGDDGCARFGVAPARLRTAFAYR